MSAARRARALVALLLLLPIVALLPGAGADHVYSHRFVYEGRVLTPDGFPVANRTVEFSSSDPFLREACAGDPHQPVTDEWGDFRFCFHAHELDPDARVAVRVGNSTLERLTDTAFRRGVITLVLDPTDADAQEAPAASDNITAPLDNQSAEAGGVPKAWNETYRIGGKVWRRGDLVLEGVQVYGLAMPQVPVRLSVLLPNGSVQHHELRTDDYGDFDATIVLDEDVPAEDVRVRIESLGVVQTRRLDTFSHRTTVGFFLPSDRDGDPFQVNFQNDTTNSGAPGTRSPPIHPGLLLGLALAVTGMVALAKRRRGAK